MIVCRECEAPTVIVKVSTKGKTVVERIRECSVCSKRVTTYESRINPMAIVKSRFGRRRGLNLSYGRLTPEARKERYRRDQLRRSAREEAAETGEPVANIYKRWGCE